MLRTVTEAKLNKKDKKRVKEKNFLDHFVVNEDNTKFSKAQNDKRHVLFKMYAISLCVLARHKPARCRS